MWEQFVVQVGSRPDAINQALWGYGQQGWELVAVSKSFGSHGYDLFFKRAKPVVK